MIQFEQGCTYDVAHLRPFDLVLAKQGHPLACLYDEIPVSVKAFRAMSEYTIGFDYWTPKYECWQIGSAVAGMLARNMRLAPLAIRDGRALHVGDVIEWRETLDHLWLPRNVDPSEVGDSWANVRTYYGRDWRWPESKA
jgi:hypothetical protein